MFNDVHRHLGRRNLRRARPRRSRRRLPAAYDLRLPPSAVAAWPGAAAIVSAAVTTAKAATRHITTRRAPIR